ncbi:hypothetical protein GCM10018790_34190 [Kitasatospora xanthocidica]|nr:hypothetical protein GCM10018790_34190 [Kitasatospora xanthocidica]
MHRLEEPPQRAGGVDEIGHRGPLLGRSSGWVRELGWSDGPAGAAAARGSDRSGGRADRFNG